MKGRTHIWVALLLVCLTPRFKNLDKDVSSPVCRTDDVYTGDAFFPFKKKKYILYDVNLGEGFNLQKEVLYRVALAVYYLNQEVRTQVHYLVLPPWCYLTHWGREKKHNRIKWSVFFNMKVLQNVIPVIEYTEYEKEFGPHADYILSYRHFIGDWSKMNEKKSFQFLDIEKCHVENYKLKKNLCKNCDYKYSVVYSGNCANVKGKKTECLEFFFITSYFVSSTLSDIFHYDIDSVLIKHGSNILVSFVNELVEANLEDVLPYSEDLINEGNQFVEKNFKSNNNYISCHLRYTDFRKISTYDVSPIEISLLKLLYIMFLRKSSIIFVSTDEKKQVKKVIDRQFSQYKNFFFFYENEKLHTGQVAIIDQWICIRSGTFVGNIFSRFSMHIKWERSLIGKGGQDHNLDLCGYSINTDEGLRKKYSDIQDTHLDEEALQKLHPLYMRLSQTDKKFLRTICYDFAHHYPQNVSIYRRGYVPPELWGVSNGGKKNA
ncbi:GDP-fucose protein O-fucosyltransferase 2, putative [Plasmodium knowlesi strain H]|uniref:GDP-fucose protein O-fucosyltransferase 2 n=3 Tax=Plasmodium knowlesi TaxID=5850 RepID=A0A5K1VM11_PLAKH|nr:GDP-fucose protein O-fucosyltransferase 2, putative [Plasmodium knowlesi strain H]OTN67543.1 putative GDP-fucose protein O-fucosyltransferase 2 [Plasmodium knowlesi]CAA9987362.1 GDP-fucose protein O-fucosyltransferase 2, putative [Plasmodium knowlesi strain H]SBO23349.1 GDP-fucose protein O-fucosyltransferase 2, putative [Plasmodium knowlesi strain H]SBO24492.1 GDP-fucose protein O-fucosyltransferase 2, putative [Plasmodium knowlesi strain H]VVS76836.1 GDP-fucose protein O-fucosyltransferas|eukprot:XP_002258365.1 hypothetical protein, conserved in Plasmodium species [Plasmodium knowlesi strain H]